MIHHDLRDHIGQMLMVGFKGLEPTPEIIELIEQHRVGNIILFSRNIKSKEQVAALTAKLQSIARNSGHTQPLLIATDQENGMVRRFDDLTTFPGNMAQGAINDANISYRIAFATGCELLTAGINMNLAPDVDVNNNPLNPVIGVRSFGEDPALVGTLGAAAVHGLQDAGIVANLKHFPGHGDTATDSHLALPIVSHAMDRLDAVELPPFIAGIAANAASIMISHIALPAIVGDATPACLAPAVVTDLLRQRLNYQGVIMTDCLEMDAVKETVGVTQGTIMAANAGNDLILISHTYSLQIAAIHGLLFACQEGKVSLQTIEAASARMRALKARCLSWEMAIPAYDLDQHRDLAKEAYARSVTIVQNQRNSIPLNPSGDEHVLVIIPQRNILTMVEDKNYPTMYLAEQILKRNPAATIHFLHDNESVESMPLQQKIAHADTIIVCTINALRDPAQKTVMQHLITTGKPVIGLALFQPYDWQAFQSLDTYMVTYEFTRPAVDAALSVIFGERKAQGVLPVTL